MATHTPIDIAHARPAHRAEAPVRNRVIDRLLMIASLALILAAVRAVVIEQTNRAIAEGSEAGETVGVAIATTLGTAANIAADASMWATIIAIVYLILRWTLGVPLANALKS